MCGRGQYSDFGLDRNFAGVFPRSRPGRRPGRPPNDSPGSVEHGVARRGLNLSGDPNEVADQMCCTNSSHMDCDKGPGNSDSFFCNALDKAQASRHNTWDMTFLCLDGRAYGSCLLATDATRKEECRKNGPRGAGIATHREAGFAVEAAGPRQAKGMIYENLIAVNHDEPIGYPDRST